MKKQLLVASLSMLLSGPALSSDFSFSNPKTILPNEDIQSFQLADLDGNGTIEIVYLNSNGELKYASQGMFIDESIKDFIGNTVWDVVDREGFKIKINISSRGYLSYTINKGMYGQGSGLIIENGVLQPNGTSSYDYLMIDSVTTTQISGKFMYSKGGINSKVPFTATKSK